MAIIINNVRASLSMSEDEIILKALSTIKKRKSEIKNSYIMKSSVDARHRNNLCLVCSVGVELFEDERKIVENLSNPSIKLREETAYAPEIGTLKLESRPLIVGFGPAGMFAGLMLAKYGYRPIIVERGDCVENRVNAVETFFNGGELDSSTNVQFGEGGAGTFSDGKLTTRIGDFRCETVIDEFIKSGAPEKIKHMAKPHIGTDNLREVLKNLRNRIIELGGEVHFNTKLDSVNIKNGKITSVTLNSQETKAETVVLAIGHSSRDTFEMASDKGIYLEPKAFSVGVRIEHLQQEINRALYGEFANHPALPQGEYQLSYREGERAVYTFCMCPGGSVVAATSENGGSVTNGMSLYKRDGKNANSAMVVSVSPSDFGTAPLAGVNFQRELERRAFESAGNYKAPCQTVKDFQDKNSKLTLGRVYPTYPRGVTPCNLHTILPNFVTDMMDKGFKVFDRKLSGFSALDSVLTGVETRTSSPVRMTRGETFEAKGIEGLYPTGEGAGYAGGIMSAAVDGMRVAEAIMKKYAPFD